MTKLPCPSVLHHLVDAHGELAKKVKTLTGRVRTLTKQRDQAHARNAELRETLARYQRALAEANSRSQLSKSNAWSMSAERSPR